jgi:hypothetical protein
MPQYSRQKSPDPSFLSPSLPIGLRFKTLNVPFSAAARELCNISLHNISVDWLPGDSSRMGRGATVKCGDIN